MVGVPAGVGKAVVGPLLQAGSASGVGPFPPMVYTAPVALTLLGGLAILYAIGTEVTDWTVLGLAPWIASGAALHVLYQQPAFFPATRPLFDNPMIYLTTAAVTVVVWSVSALITDMRPPGASCARQLAATGTGVLIALVGYSLYVSTAIAFIRPLWPVLGFSLAAVATGFVWIALSLTFTDVVAVTGRTGAAVVFGHALDGISTALGIDVLGVEERTPFAEGLLDVAAGLPTADVIGVGWVFLLVKLLLALTVVVAFKDFLERRPTEARLVLILVAAVGLAPGVHNLLLFVVIETVGLA